MAAAYGGSIERAFGSIPSREAALMRLAMAAVFWSAEASIPSDDECMVVFVFVFVVLVLVFGCCCCCGVDKGPPLGAEKSLAEWELVLRAAV